MSSPANDLLVILCTFPSIEAAGEIAQALVGERLCACVNMLPHTRSIYQWKGEIVNNEEVLCLIKTASSRHAALEARLRELHPYEVPEIVSLRAAEVNDSYLRWVADETSP